MIDSVHKKPIRQTFLWSFLLMVPLLVLGVFFSSSRVSAAYDGASLIDNSMFLNSNSMSKTEIQSFLVGKGAGLANLSFILDCDVAGTQAKQIYLSIGAPCGQSTPASHIIYYAAQIYGINPQVILATMQKEQSLTTAANPTSWQINQAMGYACPDSGGCGSSTYFYQIDNGAWVLRFHYERARGNMSWWYTSTSWTCGTEKKYYKPNLLPNQNVNFYDDSNVLYRTHFVENAATSSLYCYTPHAYNNPQGLFGLPAYGSTGQYYSGSYNFVKFFELWFGSTHGGEIGSVLRRLWNPKTSTHYYTARENDRFAAKQQGYNDDNIAALSVSPTQEPGMIPIYSMYNGRLVDNWLVPDGMNRYWGIVYGGYRDDGVAFYAYPSGGGQACAQGNPVYQMWQGGKTEHFYTSSGGEHYWGIIFGGYIDDRSANHSDSSGSIAFCAL